MPETTPVLSRRRFLGSTAVMAAPLVIPAAALGRDGTVAPSNRITMGLIGCGGMGWANMSTFMRMPDVEVLAVCDPDTARRDDCRARVDRHNDSPGGCASYDHFHDLLGRDDIDAVVVGSPDHWHAVHVVSSARAGKDIYGEKPLSLTVRQGRVMSDAVRRYGRVFQTGSQQRSDPRFRLACELVRNGRLGRIRRVTCGLPAGETTGNHPPIPAPAGFDYDLWLGPAPAAPYCESRTHYVFRHILDYSGGKLTDWGAHHIDIAQWALGTMNGGPTRIEGVGTFPADGLWNAALTYDIRCTYENGVEMLVTSRAENGVLFEGDDGRLFVTRGRIEASPGSLLETTFGPRDVRLQAPESHRRNFIDCVRSRREPVAPIEHAHRSITIAHLGNISMRLGRPVRWNPETETITGDPNASRQLDRSLRAPWRL